MIISGEEREKIISEIERRERFSADSCKGASKDVFTCKAQKCKNMIKKCKEGCPKNKPECD